MPWRAAVQIFAVHEFLYSVCFFIGIYFSLLFCLCLLLFVCNWEVVTLGVRESWAHKRLFNLPSQFSRLGTQGPASHVVLCVIL